MRRANRNLYRWQRAYTLAEVAATVAVLVIVLGLLVDLAEHVRTQSAQALTHAVLRKLDTAMARYCSANGGAPPYVDALITPAAGQRDRLEEASLQREARINSRQFMDALLALPDGGALADNLPLSIFDPRTRTLRDAWGTPIVFMAHMDPAVGMAPRGSWFFFSAGPDRRFLTRTDNLYSYEGTQGAP